MSTDITESYIGDYELMSDGDQDPKQAMYIERTALIENDDVFVDDGIKRIKIHNLLSTHAPIIAACRLRA